MKLQRYNVGRTNVQELEAQKASRITPTEAANVQLAKFAAISAVAEGVGDVATTMSNIRAEQELNNAVNDLDDALLKVDRDIEAMPVQLDENGNVVFDAEDLTKMESEARTSLISAVRENIQSGTARRAFDRHTVGLNRRRGQVYQVAQINREKKTLEANSEFRRQGLIQDGRFNDALEQAREDVITGIVGPDAYNDARREIKKARDVDVVSRVLLNPEATEASIEMLTDSLEKGQWDSALGFDEPEMELNDIERVRLQGQLYQHENGIDARATAATKLTQQQNTLEVLRGIVSGQVGPMEVTNLPLESVGLDGIKYLLTQSRTAEVGLSSSPESMTAAREMILEMVVEGTTNTTPEMIKQAIRNDAGIMAEDQLSLMGDVDKAVNDISGQRPHRRLLDAELVTLQGMTSEQSLIGTTTDRRGERTAGKQLERDFWSAAMAGGIDFTEAAASQWLEDNKGKYYRIALTETMAAKGVDIAQMPAERAEAIPWIEGQILISEKRFWKEEWNEKDPDEQSLILTESLSEIELLMKNVWGDQ